MTAELEVARRFGTNLRRARKEAPEGDVRDG